MKLYDKRSARDIMVLSIWLAFFIITPLIRHATIPMMSWREAATLVAVMCALATPPVAALGYMTDRLNIRKKYGYDLTWTEARFLNRCEGEVLDTMEQMVKEAEKELR